MIEGPTRQKNDPAFSMRHTIKPGDEFEVERLLSSTGVFSQEEVKLGRDLAEEALRSGSEKSAYYFVFLEDSEEVIHAYACYGPVPITVESWDFYWMAVHPNSQGKGYATLLTESVCNKVLAKGGKFLFAEVSSLPMSEPIRKCHARNGFEKLIQISDFYKPGDDKIIYRKLL